VPEEGAKAFGWNKRSPVPGSMPGRFKRGVGMGMIQHHGGLMGYHEGEEAFARLATGRGAAVFGTELELTADGNVAVYPYDTGLVINPLVAEADMVGSLVESTQLTTDPIPWDREFPGTQHYSVGYLSYRLPAIMDVPQQTQVYIHSLEPRWFYGVKGFSETSIGAVPGALANAIYNACGVRIREHPITREKTMAGLLR